jgi:hypothetical protein
MRYKKNFIAIGVLFAMWLEEPFPIGVETPRRGVSTRTAAITSNRSSPVPPPLYYDEGHAILLFSFLHKRRFTRAIASNYLPDLY